MRPDVIAAHDLSDGDFFCLDPSEVGTGGWLVTKVRDSDASSSPGYTYIDASAPYGGIIGTLRIPRDQAVLLTDGSDCRINWGMQDKQIADNYEPCVHCASRNPIHLCPGPTLAGEVARVLGTQAPAPGERLCPVCREVWHDSDSEQHGKSCSGGRAAVPVDDRPFWPVSAPEPAGVNPFTRLREMQVHHEMKQRGIQPEAVGPAWVQQWVDNCILTPSDWVVVHIFQGNQETWAPVSRPIADFQEARDERDRLEKERSDALGLPVNYHLFRASDLQSYFATPRST